MALLSNALGHGVEEIVAHFALDEYMAAAVSSVETGAVKPAPRMFSTLFGLLGVSPADAVMVGDSVEDDVKAPSPVAARRSCWTAPDGAGTSRSRASSRWPSCLRRSASK